MPMTTETSVPEPTPRAMAAAEATEMTSPCLPSFSFPVHIDIDIVVVVDDNNVALAIG